MFCSDFGVPAHCLGVYFCLFQILIDSFSQEIVECGLNEESLEAALIQACDWCVKDVPTAYISFY